MNVDQDLDNQVIRKQKSAVDDYRQLSQVEQWDPNPLRNVLKKDLFEDEELNRKYNSIGSMNYEEFIEQKSPDINDNNQFDFYKKAKLNSNDYLDFHMK